MQMDRGARTSSPAAFGVSPKASELKSQSAGRRLDATVAVPGFNRIGPADLLLPAPRQLVQKKKLLVARLADQGDGAIGEEGEQLLLRNILDSGGFRRRRHGGGGRHGRGRRAEMPVPR